MLIETWVLLMFILMIFAICFIALAGWTNESKRHEECQQENARLRDEIRSRDIIIEKLNGKILLKTATEFYNEGKKK